MVLYLKSAGKFLSSNSSVTNCPNLIRALLAFLGPTATYDGSILKRGHSLAVGTMFMATSIQ
jgi:hypothetical protein